MNYILCQPAIKRFEWELEVCITRLKKLGITDIVLLFPQWDSGMPKYFEETYGVEVHAYSDAQREKTYIPSVKPYILDEVSGRGQNAREGRLFLH